MTSLLFTPIASPFLEQPYTLLATMDPPITVVPVFYGDASERSTWGKLTWQGQQLTGSLLQRVKQINRIFDDVKPDRVFLSQYVGWVTWFARAKALRRGIPFYFFFLDAFCPRGHLRSALREFLFKKTVHKSGGIGVMGKTTHQICGRLYPGPIIDTPYCFDVSEMLAFDDSLRSADKTVFLYSGRLVNFRDPLGTLRIFAKLHETYGDKVELILSGKGPLEEACRSLIQELKLQNAVRWMNDFKDWHDLRNLYRHAHVLLSLGKYSTWNLTVGEAMAAGMGVIATNTTEAANTLILDAYNGYLVKHGDLRQTLAAMDNYISHPERIPEHAQRSRQIVDATHVAIVSKTLHSFLYSFT